MRVKVGWSLRHTNAALSTLWIFERFSNNDKRIDSPQRARETSKAGDDGEECKCRTILRSIPLYDALHLRVTATRLLNAINNAPSRITCHLNARHTRLAAKQGHTIVALLYKRRVSRATGFSRTTTIPAAPYALSTFHHPFDHL